MKKFLLASFLITSYLVTGKSFVALITNVNAQGNTILSAAVMSYQKLATSQGTLINNLPKAEQPSTNNMMAQIAQKLKDSVVDMAGKSRISDDGKPFSIKHFFSFVLPTDLADLVGYPEQLAAATSFKGTVTIPVVEKTSLDTYIDDLAKVSNKMFDASMAYLHFLINGMWVFPSEMVVLIFLEEDLAEVHISWKANKLVLVSNKAKMTDGSWLTTEASPVGYNYESNQLNNILPDSLKIVPSSYLKEKAIVHVDPAEQTGTQNAIQTDAGNTRYFLLSGETKVLAEITPTSFKEARMIFSVNGLFNYFLFAPLDKDNKWDQFNIHVNTICPFSGAQVTNRNDELIIIQLFCKKARLLEL